MMKHDVDHGVNGHGRQSTKINNMKYIYNIIDNHERKTNASIKGRYVGRVSWNSTVTVVGNNTRREFQEQIQTQSRPLR